MELHPQGRGFTMVRRRLVREPSLTSMESLVNLTEIRDTPLVQKLLKISMNIKNQIKLTLLSTRSFNLESDYEILG